MMFGRLPTIVLCMSISIFQNNNNKALLCGVLCYLLLDFRILLDFSIFTHSFFYPDGEENCDQNSYGVEGKNDHKPHKIARTRFKISGKDDKQICARNGQNQVKDPSCDCLHICVLKYYICCSKREAKKINIQYARSHA